MPDVRRLVEKLMGMLPVLRDDAVSVVDYTEQLTYLLFLKMAHERATRALAPERIVAEEYDWPMLVNAQGEELEQLYERMLSGLAKADGVVGTIFRKSINRVQDPANLRRLIRDYIDKEQWSAQGTDLMGDAYEAILASWASETKSGAGEYFTPRVIVEAMVECVQPTIDDTVVDPACGTGGFLLKAHDYVARNADRMTPDQRDHLRDELVTGHELKPANVRVASMNMLLHGIGTPSGASVIHQRDSLLAAPGNHWSVVLANPPFGTKSNRGVIGDDGTINSDDLSIERTDFTASTKNKQLNFVQHIATILDMNGRAAVILPDNVLFEGGAGEKIRRRLLRDFDLHTILRLPTGIWYATGVKANVLFFDKKPANPGTPWTTKTWVYDLRTNKHFTLKQNPIRAADLADFVTEYRPGKPRDERVESERWKAFTYDELVARDKANLDVIWLKDDSLEDLNNLPEPSIIAREIVEELSAALAEFEAIAAALNSGASDE